MLLGDHESSNEQVTCQRYPPPWCSRCSSAAGWPFECGWIARPDEAASYRWDLFCLHRHHLAGAGRQLRRYPCKRSDGELRRRREISGGNSLNFREFEGKVQWKVCGHGVRKGSLLDQTSDAVSHLFVPSNRCGSDRFRWPEVSLWSRCRSNILPKETNHGRGLWRTKVSINWSVGRCWPGGRWPVID